MKIFLPQELKTLNENENEYNIAYHNLREMTKKNKGESIEFHPCFFFRPFMICFRVPTHYHADFYYTKNEWFSGGDLFEGDFLDFHSWFQTQKLPICVNCQKIKGVPIKDRKLVKKKGRKGSPPKKMKLWLLIKNYFF